MYSSSSRTHLFLFNISRVEPWGLGWPGAVCGESQWNYDNIKAKPTRDKSQQHCGLVNYHVNQFVCKPLQKIQGRHAAFRENVSSKVTKTVKSGERRRCLKGSTLNPKLKTVKNSAFDVYHKILDSCSIGYLIYTMSYL